MYDYKPITKPSGCVRLPYMEKENANPKVSIRDYACVPMTQC